MHTQEKSTVDNPKPRRLYFKDDPTFSQFPFTEKSVITIGSQRKNPIVVICAIKINE